MATIDTATSEHVEDDVPEPVAAGYVVVQGKLAIFGIGATEAEAEADAAKHVDLDEDGEPNVSGLDTKPASQALIDEVRENGPPRHWSSVDGVLCTLDQADAWGE